MDTSESVRVARPGYRRVKTEKRNGHVRHARARQREPNVAEELAADDAAADGPDGATGGASGRR